MDKQPFFKTGGISRSLSADILMGEKTQFSTSSPDMLADRLYLQQFSLFLSHPHVLLTYGVSKDFLQLFVHIHCVLRFVVSSFFVMSYCVVSYVILYLDTVQAVWGNCHWVDKLVPQNKWSWTQLWLCSLTYMFSRPLQQKIACWSKLLLLFPGLIISSWYESVFYYV